MNWSDPILPFQMHPLGFVESFRRYGVDVHDLLARAGLDPALLDAPDSRISYRQFVRLVRCGLQLCRRPGLGLLIGRDFDWYYYGLPGMAILASTSFKKATAILHRYTCLVQPYYAPYRSRPAFFVDNRQRVIIPIQYLISTALGDETLRRFELEFRTGLLLQILHRFAGASDKPANVEVQLAMPRPAHAHLYRELAPYDFRFDCAASRFIVPAAMLKTRADHLRNGVCEHVLRYCREELDRIEPSVAWAERVRALLYESIPHYLTQKEVAERLEMTTRTLARKLRQEQTSFTAVLNEVRCEVATYLLNTTTLSVADVAESVGFADTTNFRQAFKRWTGRSARAARAEPHASARPANGTRAATGAAARPARGPTPPCPR